MRTVVLRSLLVANRAKIVRKRRSGSAAALSGTEVCLRWDRGRMRRTLAIATLLIQLCVQHVPLSEAEEAVIVPVESSSGSTTVPVAESGAVVEPFAAPAASGSVLSVTGATVPAGSGTVVSGSGATGTGAVTRLPDVIAPDIVSSPVRIAVTEVMWMGSNLSTADEWVEIGAFSSGSAVLPRNLSGWTLATVKAGVETVIARLPDVELSSGSVLVVANAPAASSRLSREPAVVASSMSLPNTQLLLRLKNASGSIVDEVDDGVGAPMAGANPSGGAKASMERADPWRTGNAASSWKTSALSSGFDDGPPIFGTPGSLGILPSAAQPDSGGGSAEVPAPPSPSPQPPPLVRLTEVLANPSGADADEWIEIGSFHPEPLDLAAFTLRMGTTRFALSGTLPPGGHLRVGKLLSGLSLPNSSGTPELLWRDKVIDAWTYGETAEGVSLGRAVDGTVTPQCVPSPDAPNTGVPLDPFIRIQSSSASSGKASFNLEAAVKAGSMAGASCAWTYPDGYANASCNPPSHSMPGPLVGDVVLTLRDYCGNTMTRLLRVEIAGKTMPFEDAFSCAPTAFTGAVVSELFANPEGEDDDAEWIELANASEAEVPLCGWSLDDDEGGSDPFRLDRLRLPAGERLLLRRPDTGLALNNDRDAVRLFAPLPQGGSGARQIVRYAFAPEGRSYARRDDGVFLWTAPTPEQANAFEPVAIPAHVDARIVQAMPNPAGTDSDGGEWIEIRNMTGYPLPLTGWTLRTASDTASLDHVILSPRATLRLDDRLPLANANGYVRLFDRDGTHVSTLAWSAGADGRSVVLPQPAAHVSDLSFIASDDCLTWKARDGMGDSHFVSMIGVRTEKVNECITFVSALMNEKKFDQEMYSFMSGSVLLLAGTDIATILLREGVMLVDEAFDSPFLAAYRLFEQEARAARRGIWAYDDASTLVDASRSIAAQRRILAEEGLVVRTTPAAGIVTRGESLSVETNVPAEISIAIGSGALEPYVAPVPIDRDATVRVLAVAHVQSSSGSAYVHNSIQPYAVLKSRYPEVRVTEVYPSPRPGESEWVELWNPTHEAVPLLGWLIDDTENAGSRPSDLPVDAAIGPGGRVVIGGLPIAWNNGGDDVRLIAPNGREMHRVAYGPVKKGFAFAVSLFASGATRGGCVTHEPTPGALNRCVPAPAKKASAKKRAPARKSSPSAPVKYRNVLPALSVETPVGALFRALRSVGTPVGSVPLRLPFFVVLCAFGGLCAAGVLARMRGG